jgi:dihydrofolate reductase
MSKIVISEFLTLDGVMQAPGSDVEDPSGGFDKGGWQLNYPDHSGGSWVLDGFARAEGLLLGRRTYDIFAGYWPNQPADDIVGKDMNAFTKYVVSTTLSEPLNWQNSTLIKDDVPGAIGELRAKPGKDILVIGSGDLAQTLITNNLVDEYRLMVYPYILGKGKKLFRDGTERPQLKLADSKEAGGVLLLTYVPA